MTITLQASPHDQLEESLATSAGRFGRQIGMIAWPDPELASVRSATVLGMRARVQYRDYQIDSFVLAEAIIDRLSAGGLTTRLQEQAVQGERSRRGERVSLVSRLRTRRCPRWAKYFALARQKDPHAARDLGDISRRLQSAYTTHCCMKRDSVRRRRPGARG